MWKQKIKQEQEVGGMWKQKKRQGQEVGGMWKQKIRQEVGGMKDLY